MNSVHIKPILLAALLTATSMAGAQQFYGSLNFGRSNIDLGVSGVDDDDTTFSLAGGYQVNENVAIEVGYVDFGGIEVSGNGSAKIDADAIEFSVLGMLPLSQQAGLQGRLGFDMWDATLKYYNVPGFGTGKESDDGTDLFFGVGGYVKLGDNANVHLEYQFHELDDIDVDTLTVGFSLFF